MTRNRLESILPPERIRKSHPLKVKIRAAGLSQADMAAAITADQGTLSRWLNHKRAMPASVERDIREILDKLESEVGHEHL